MGLWGYLLRPIRILGIYLLLFLLARVALVLVYPLDFAGLDGATVFGAFCAGSLYDLSIILTVTGLPLLMLALPFPFADGRCWQSAWGWIAYGAFVLFAFLHAGDLVYFDFVHRHFGPEVAIAGEDLDQTVELVLTQFPLVLLGFVAAMVGMFFLWRRTLRPPRDGWLRPMLRPVLTILLAGLIVLGARGRIGGERLGVQSAFDEHSGPAALIIISGPLSAIHFHLQSRSLETDFYPFSVALGTTRSLVFSEGESAADPEYPLWRARDATPGPKPNVVVIMLEGWTAGLVDCIRAQRGEEPLGLTPRFDELSSRGVLYSRFYAQGQRTRHGMAGIVAGFPSLPGIPYLGRGMELMNLPWLGRMAMGEGYETWFLQGSRRTSQRYDEIAALGGFEHFLGAEDIPGETVGTGGLTALRAWDHDLLAEAGRRLNGSSEPFLGFVFTSCTHEPLKWPRPEFDRFPDDTRENRYRNALAYADHALGEFFDLARREPWFDHTIFIIAADHVQRRLGATDDPASLFHIPALILAPGLTPRVDSRVGAQTDLLATITDLAGWSTPHAGIGKSLFDDTEAQPEKEGAGGPL